jgi:adenine-specific DNA-methyltransferase
MATGISRTKSNGDSSQVEGKLEKARSEAFLSYVGKLNESEILSLAPAAVTQLWRSNRLEYNVPNHLYYGDNLPIMAHLVSNENLRGKVRLIYIDPPFSTQSVFQSRNQTDAYADLLAGPDYIEFLRQRLIFLREILADDGSIYVHLDENMAFHIKVVMDELFGRHNFRNWITRKKCNPKNYTRKTYGNISDYILFYTKSDNYVWNRPLEEWTIERANKEYQYIEQETGRRYKKVPIHAPGVRNGETGKPWRGMNPPPGKHWQYTPNTLDEMDARGEIYWSLNGNPRRKVYLDNSNGVPVQDIWLNFRDAHNQNIAVTGYPTEKNSDMLAQLITASSNPGDLVLDCFAGSGTTLVVASELGRKWIGVDASVEAITTILRRFALGSEPMGDYVEKPQKPGAAQMALFEVEKPADNHRTDIESRIISDFSLYAAEPYQGKIDSLIAQWEEWQSKTLADAEKEQKIKKGPKRKDEANERIVQLLNEEYGASVIHKLLLSEGYHLSLPTVRKRIRELKGEL